MSPLLRPVPLAELRTLPEGKVWEVDQPIAGLESLTPVRGQVEAVHHGTALEVSGEAETIITLCCARCLQHYNQGLRAEVRELIDFRGGPHSPDNDPMAPLGDDLDDRLDPAGSFDPERWLFEQLNLQLPLVNRCGKECPGPTSWGSGPPAAVDPRWEALKSLSHPPA